MLKVTYLGVANTADKPDDVAELSRLFYYSIILGKLISPNLQWWAKQRIEPMAEEVRFEVAH